ncbi:hypothetical protein [Arenibacterium sp. LLYu02]|uniref:hypothetical protein n=1 Tax=Arenibacterium sp. LLYu02 TaxID=3404132 RepID=UPI003B214747
MKEIKPPKDAESLQELWDAARYKIGDCVLIWGTAMSTVYRIPATFGMENAEEFQIHLAGLSGDSQRIRTLIRGIKDLPATSEDEEIQSRSGAVSALKLLDKLSDDRDAIVHGLPVYNMKSDRNTREIIRNGLFLVQTRKADEAKRFRDLFQATEDFLSKMSPIVSSLRRVSVGISVAELRSLIEERNKEL